MARNSQVSLDESISFEAVYSANHKSVLRLCNLLLSDRQEAEEVAQEVFVKAYREYENLNQTEFLLWKPWLMRVSVNACRDRQRSSWWKRWRMAGAEYQEEIYPNRGQTPEESALSRETEGRIWRAFQGLSARQQEVFALRHVDEWSTDEVAEILGMTSGTVKRHLFRAIQRLRRVGDCR